MRILLAPVFCVALMVLAGCGTMAAEGHKYVDLGATVGHAVVDTSETFYNEAKALYEWVKCLVTDCPPAPTVENP